MATSYTSLLGLALPVTGELNGTWGDTVNNAITSLLDTAVAGTTTLSTDADVTLTTTTGASNQARQAILLCSGARTALRTITAPAQSKIYTVINATTGGFSVKVVGAGPTTGVTIVAGESAVIAWNGSDFIKVSNTGGSASFTNVTVSGTTTLSGLTASTALALNSSKEVVSVTNTGTGNNVLSASPTLTGTVAGASLQLSSLTSGRVTYAGTSGLLQDSANLTFDGTTLTVNALAVTNGVTLSGGTANGVAYLNGSKVLTTGSALTFDGTSLGVGTASLSGIAQRTIDLNASANSALVFKAADTTFAYLYADNAANEFRMYGGSSKNLTFYANASEQMRLTTTGLGIGTSSPGAKLHVSNGVNADSGSFTGLVIGGSDATNARTASLIKNTSSPYDLTIRSQNNTGTTTGSLFFQNGSTTQMTLDSSGNLGIGTSSPSTRLQVNFSSATAYSSGATGNGLLIYNTSTTTNQYAGITFQGEPTAGNAGQASIYGTTTGSGAMDLVFSTRGSSTLAERMRLDSSGNLGLGVTPSAWGGSGGNIDLPNGKNITSQGYNIAVGANAYYNGGWKYITSSYASRYSQDLGQHQWFTAPSGTAGNAISFTQSMTLDASGNLGIGTSSPAYKLDVSGASGNGASGRFTFADTNQFSSLQFFNGATFVGGFIAFGSNSNGGYGYGNLSMRYDAIGSHVWTNGSSTTATLNSSGNLGLGVTPSAWQSTWKSMEFGKVGQTIAGFTGSDPLFRMGTNLYTNSSGTDVYAESGKAATQYLQYVGQHQWFTAPSGTAGNAISFSQSMTLDSSGNLGIGTSSPISKVDAVVNISGGSDILTIQNQNTGANTTKYAGLKFKGNDTVGTSKDSAYIRAFPADQDFVGSYLSFWTRASDSVTERMILNSSGNLGLGVTPSAWASTHKALQMNWSAFSTDAANGETSVSTNAYASASTTWNYRSTAPASRYTQDYYGKHIWFIAPNGTAGNAISFTQAMTLNASGNLGIGTSSPTNTLTVGGTSRGTVRINGTDGASPYLALDNTATTNGRRYIIYSGGIGASEFNIYDETALTNRVTIDSSGYWYCVGVYNATSGAGANVGVNSAGLFYRSTSSLKYKTDVQDATHGLAEVMALRPVTYKSINDGDTIFGGLIAEEVHEAGLTEFVQYADDGSPDALAYSNMVSLCIKAIQEQQAIINQLKARLDAANL